MTAVERLLTTVAAHDKRALMHADAVVFRLHRGQSTIEAIKRGEHTSDGFEQKHIVYCATEFREFDNTAGHTHAPVEGFNGFDSSLSAQYDHDLRTLLSRIRAGDTCTLNWTRGNGSENTRSIGWVRDELRLVIANDQGKRETYLVAVLVGPDNTARMITRAR